MKFALHFILLALTAVPALLVFRHGVVKRKTSNFFCFGMNVVMLPILHPLLVVVVSKMFLWIAFVSTVDMKSAKPDDLQRKIESLEDPSGTVTTPGGTYEGKVSWRKDEVYVQEKKQEVWVPVATVARVTLRGHYSIAYFVFTLLFSLVIPASVLLLVGDLYNPKSVSTSFACAAVSFLLWYFTVQI